METEEALRKQLFDARRKLDKIERERRSEKLLSVLGKAYKYHNGYDNEHRWWLYTKPLHISDDGHLVCFSFETTSDDEIKIELAKNEYFGPTDGYQQIEMAEFDMAWKAVQNRVASI